MDNKQDTLINVYEILLGQGRIRDKKGFAALLGVNYSGLVAAMNGNEKFLTNSLVAKAVALVSGSDIPAPQQKREPTSIDKAIEAIQSSNLITLKAQEQTDRLLTLLEHSMGIRPGTFYGEKENPRIKK